MRIAEELGKAPALKQVKTLTRTQPQETTHIPRQGGDGIIRQPVLPGVKDPPFGSGLGGTDPADEPAQYDDGPTQHLRIYGLLLICGHCSFRSRYQFIDTVRPSIRDI